MADDAISEPDLRLIEWLADDLTAADYAADSRDEFIVKCAHTVVRASREIAREEIASLCGLVLRRLGAAPVNVQLEEAIADPSHPGHEGALQLAYAGVGVLASIFGEALRDFGSTPDEPGPEEAA